MSSAAVSGAETDLEWQEIMAIDADIEPVMSSIRHLRDVFCSLQGSLSFFCAGEVALAVSTRSVICRLRLGLGQKYVLGPYIIYGKHSVKFRSAI